ncbi:MAG: glycosyltransferase family 4 protein [Nitrososphaerales archaeon]|jgi:glycosyltransferase involved in cell wall biosynthesis
MLGGAEWYVRNVSAELVRRGHEVHVFTADRCNGTSAAAFEMIDGINVHRVPLKVDLTYRLKVWDGLYEALASGRFDVIHTYDYAQPHSAVAIRAGHDAGTGTVLTVFDIHSMIPRVWYKQAPMKLMEGYMARRTLPRAGRVLVRAPNLVEPLLEMGAVADRTVVTSSGVRDDSLGDFDGPEFRRGRGIEGSPEILYMGRLNPLKGPQFLVEAAPEVLKRFPGATFVFVGPDQAGYGGVLKSRVARLGIESHFHFLGPIYDFEEKMRAYASCDAFALPTSYEGTSQAIFEAMAQGRPVVATRVGGVPYQFTDGEEGFLVPHGDVRALASRLVDVLSDRALAKTMGEKGRTRVQSQRYSVLTEALEGIYLEVRSAN